jgi:acetyl-CoA carboxylase biotin carboxylase subunit
LADQYGTVVPFVERECSIQRRHQKVVEESPSPVLDARTRKAMAECAAQIAREVGYTNAGTIEFLLDDSGAFFFLEMNTRLQVEHPVTELVTGIDLVTWQMRLALGERLTVSADEALHPRGHAIECRIYAEDPDKGFLPSPGLVHEISVPGGPGVRDDRGVAAGFELAVWGETRAEAVSRLRRALDEYQVVGVKTTVPFFRWLVRQPAFETAQFSTTYLDEILAGRRGEPFSTVTVTDETDAAVVAALAAWFERRDGQTPAGSTPWRLAARRDARR